MAGGEAGQELGTRTLGRACSGSKADIRLGAGMGGKRRPRREKPPNKAGKKPYFLGHFGGVFAGYQCEIVSALLPQLTPTAFPQSGVLLWQPWVENGHWHWRRATYEPNPRKWLGRQDSNLRMPVPKTGALPLGDAPAWAAPDRGDARGAAYSGQARLEKRKSGASATTSAGQVPEARSGRTGRPK